MTHIVVTQTTKQPKQETIEANSTTHCILITINFITVIIMLSKELHFLFLRFNKYG